MIGEEDKKGRMMRREGGVLGEEGHYKEGRRRIRTGG